MQSLAIVFFLCCLHYSVLMATSRFYRCLALLLQLPEAGSLSVEVN